MHAVLDATRYPQQPSRVGCVWRRLGFVRERSRDRFHLPVESTLYQYVEWPVYKLIVTNGIQNHECFYT